MMVNHELGCSSGSVLKTRIEVEDGTETEHYPTVQVGQEPVHEVLLFRSAQRHPNDVGMVFVDHLRDALVIKILYLTEG